MVIKFIECCRLMKSNSHFLRDHMLFLACIAQKNMSFGVNFEFS